LYILELFVYTILLQSLSYNKNLYTNNSAGPTHALYYPVDFVTQ